MAILLLNKQVVIIRPYHRVHAAILESQKAYMENLRDLCFYHVRARFGFFFMISNLGPPDVQRSGTCPCRKGT